MTTTDAAVLVATGAPLKLMRLEVPPLAPGQLLVDVAFSGVCHSQLNEVEGRRGPDRFLPHTLGHEGSGVVRAVGTGVTKAKPGDRVVLTWLKGAGAEVGSTRYASPDGPVNSGAVSTFLTRAVTCESRIVPIPPNMPLREAALLGCAIPTGGGIVRNTLKDVAGKSVAVFGVGGIGMSAVIVAALQGAAAVIAVDVADDKLAQAKSLGATHTVNAAAGDPVDAIKVIVGAKGVDMAIESAGRREAMEAAFRAVRDGGGLCVVAGNVSFGEKMSLDPFDLIRGKRIEGSWGGAADPDRDIPHYARLFEEGRLPLGTLIGRSYALDAINDALRDLGNGAVGRAVVDMGMAA
jgi:S-(hydroxymethyl)glutathione dehydrogenase/alcohol dehydrogenase